MTYFYYQTRTLNPRPSQEQLEAWGKLSTKSNWRIVELPNGFYQTECLQLNQDDVWVDVTRRETIDGAEAAIDGSIEHFQKKLEAASGPKVVKTFK